MKLHTLDFGNGRSRLGTFAPELKVEEFEESKLRPQWPLVGCRVGALPLPSQALDVAQYRKPHSFLSMPLHYGPHLGSDRLVVAYLAFQRQEPLWVVDAGTFITLDLVDPQGFHGGFIVPGLGPLNGCYQRGAQLQQLSPAWEPPIGPGQNSAQAVNRGLGVVLAGLFAQLRNLGEHPLILTGGDGPALEDLAREYFSVEVFPAMIHHGLSLIYREVSEK